LRSVKLEVATLVLSVKSLDRSGPFVLGPSIGRNGFWLERLREGVATDYGAFRIRPGMGLGRTHQCAQRKVVNTALNPVT
jgi:hypothetical protein